MKKKIAIIAVALVLIGSGAYYYTMFGGSRDMSTEETAFTVSGAAVTTEFTSNLDASNKKYLEKPVEITGVVSSVSGNQMVLDNTVICNLIEPDTKVQKDQKITVKGRVVGFDDLMGEVKVDKCLIIK